jgi:alpha-tubulin suppressor-like RCC1 family protein
MTSSRPSLLPIKRSRSAIIAVFILTLGAILFIALSAGVLFAESPTVLADARQKLYDMVAGDITRSLAVEKKVVSPPAIPSDIPNPVLSFNSTFSGSAVYAMGANSNGQLGIGTGVDTHTPVLLSTDVFGGPIASGPYHSLVLDKDGNLWASGSDIWGQFGDGSSPSSTASLFQTAQTGITSVAVGYYHSLVVTDDGMVLASGEGSSGQLGTGTGTDTDTWAAVAGTGALKAVSSQNSSFVITDQGALYAFGENNYGGLGVGTVGLNVYTPVIIIPSGVVDVAAGLLHTLVLMADGSVMAMGMNSYGQFGDNTTDSSTTPRLVIPSGVKSVAAGQGHSMFVMADGSLQGVGLNSYGQLGFGDTAVHSSLTTVATDVTLVSTGANHTLYVTKNGALMGMGNGSNGQLGLGDFSGRLTPDTIRSNGVVGAFAQSNSSFFLENSLVSLEIKGLSTVYSGSTANFRCDAVWADGRRTDVTAQVIWSHDSTTAAIELNTGTLDLSAVPAGETIRVSADYFNITTDKDLTVAHLPLGGATLYGCGYNSYSQLGLDTTVSLATLTEISPDDIISLAGGASHSLYVREDGSVFAMGDNSYGQLGAGDTIPRTVPVQVTQPRTAIAVGAGDYHSLIVFRDGSLYAMGRNDQGQLGDGTQENRNFPIRIRKQGVVGADGGAGHSVFLTADGAVWTVGRCIEGQLGNGTTSGSDTPFMAHAGGVTGVRAGANYTLFTTDDSAMWGMGDNRQGQLGLISSILDQLTPTVLVSSNVAQMAAGAQHSAYISQSNALYLSGNNDYGQLGNNNQGTNVYGFSQLDMDTAVNSVYTGATFSLFRTGTRTYTDTSATDYTWHGTGDNAYGQFGNGTFNWTASPVVLPWSQVKTVRPANQHVLLTRGLPGDIDGDLQHTLHDLVRALQIMTGDNDGWLISPLGDVNGDNRVGLPEAQYIMRKVGGL